jgi:hypothetical protein
MLDWDELGDPENALLLSTALGAPGALLYAMQYTGLKDKNGEQIYEGDIMDVNGEIGEVYYDSNNVCFEVNVDIDHNPCIGRYEVIGNIYENPELLGSK